MEEQRKCRSIHVDYVYDWIQFIVSGKEFVLDPRYRREILDIQADFILLPYYEIDMPSPWERVLDEARRFGIPTDNAIILVFLQESIGFIITGEEYSKLEDEQKTYFVDLGYEYIKSRREEIILLINREFREFKMMIKIDDPKSSIDSLISHRQTLLLNPDKYWSEIEKVGRLIGMLKSFLIDCLKLKVNTYIHKSLLDVIKNIYTIVFFHKEWSNIGAQLIEFLRHTYEKELEEKEEIFI